MKLSADEKELIGGRHFDGSHVEGDAVSLRISHLTSHVLTQVAFSRDAGAWETLFRDPNDGRYWERFYPNSEMHGGGPPALRALSEDEARRKYDF